MHFLSLQTLNRGPISIREHSRNRQDSSTQNRPKAEVFKQKAFLKDKRMLSTIGLLMLLLR